MQRKIGETFTYLDGHKLKVKPATNLCKGCYFYDNGCNIKVRIITGPCDNIIFEDITNVKDETKENNHIIMERKLNEVISDRINEQNIKNLAEEVSTTEPVIVHNTLSDEFDQHVAHYIAERLKSEICKLIDSKLSDIIAKARDDASQEMWTTTVTTF